MKYLKSKQVTIALAFCIVALGAIILPAAATSTTFFPPFPDTGSTYGGYGFHTESAAIDYMGQGSMACRATLSISDSHAEDYISGKAPSNNEGMQAVTLSGGQMASFGAVVNLVGYIQSRYYQGDDAWAKVTAEIQIFKGIPHVYSVTKPDISPASVWYSWQQVYIYDVILGYIEQPDTTIIMDGTYRPSVQYTPQASGLYTMELMIKGEAYSHCMSANEFGLVNLSSYPDIVISSWSVVR